MLFLHLLHLLMLAWLNSILACRIFGKFFRALRVIEAALCVLDIDTAFFA